MKSLKYVKQKAWELREIIEAESEDIFEGLKDYFINSEHEIIVKAVPDYEIDYSQAILNVGRKKLSYDEKLDENPTERLLVLAHELGHLTLHKRLTDKLRRVDPLSPYLNTDASALARYNRRSCEEIEADVFANEFVCPSTELFAEWETDETATSITLAEKYSFTQEFVKARLSEGLYEKSLENAIEKEETSSPKKDDPTQEKAAKHSESPALVEAGPGTGKTATLIMRMKHLLKKKDAKPYEMLILTFSNEAADELRTRIEEEFGAEVADDMEITTFHGFGYSQLLTLESQISEEVQILDEARQEELIVELLGKVSCDSIFDLKDPEKTATNCVRQIGRLKERRINPGILEETIKKWKDEEPEKKSEQSKAEDFLNLFREYEKAKIKLEKGEAKIEKVDFPDLINLLLDLLESDTELVKAMRAKYKWVMVDEYQDVSRAVALLLQNICGTDNPPWVVGDIRQAIYLFCGAVRENVSNFSKDFENTKIFELDKNYRSCDEVIAVANQLAELIENEDESDEQTAEFSKRWKRGAEIYSIDSEDPTINVAQADSDYAEYDGIANQVKKWIKQGIKPQDIAVLARRNKDVRNISLELGKRGIKATTTGLITSEGTAGDLAAVSTYLDGRTASLPRTVFAIGKGKYEKSVLNEAIEYFSSDEKDDLQISGKLEKLVDEVKYFEECVGELQHTGDGFSVICSFLFDGTDFLRRQLKNKDEAERSLILSEILTTLSWAVGYRYSHIGVSQKDSRIGFGQHLRNNLSSAKPSLVAPRPVTDAVQVMTCHASKGLEFPCVILAGQTLSLAKDTNWLPPALKPSKEDDTAQANALFFVGVTRAQSALLISYAKTARRTITPLLEKWILTYAIEKTSWESPPKEKEFIELNPIWGNKQSGKKLSATNLSKSSCGILVYLQDFYGARFPKLIDPLYPRFFVAVRSSLKKIIRQAEENNRKLTKKEAEDIFVNSFSDEEVLEHKHYETYKRRGLNYCVCLANNYDPDQNEVEFIDSDKMIRDENEDLTPLRLDLIAHYRKQNGESHAILFRPESIIKPKNGEQLPDEIAWTKVKESSPRKKLPFILLRSINPDLQPWVFSGEDGKLYRLKWNRNVKTMDKDAALANQKLQAFSEYKFEATINEFFCDAKCNSRVTCPHWMGSIN